MNDNTGNGAKQTDASISETDRAIAMAKQRKAEKENTAASGAAGAPPAETKAARRILTSEERLERAKKIEDERTARKTKREADRAAKKVEQESARQPAHMKKVEKAGAALAPLNPAAQGIFDDAKESLDPTQLMLLAEHLKHHNRVEATKAAGTAKLTLGMRVVITKCEQPKFIGKVGTIVKVHRIRAYVKVEGFSKEAYCFTSDVSPVAETTVVAQDEALASVNEDDASAAA
jgi:hypothetical protein